MTTQPTRAEADAEESVRLARKNLLGHWRKTREGRVHARATEEHPHLTRLIAALTANQKAYIEEGLPDELYAMADAAAEAKDPYGYRGLTRSMFL